MGRKVRIVLRRRVRLAPASEQHRWLRTRRAGQGEKTILVVDDDQALRHLVSRALSREGYDVVDLSNSPDAVLQLTQVKFHAAIIEVRTSDMAGVNLMQVMSRICPDTIVIALTTQAGPCSQFQSISKPDGVFACLKKPCNLEELRNALQRAFAPRLTSTGSPVAEGKEEALSRKAATARAFTPVSSVL